MWVIVRVKDTITVRVVFRFIITVEERDVAPW